MTPFALVPVPGPAGALQGALQAFAVAGYACAQLALLAYASHRWVVLFRRRRAPRATPGPAPCADWPRVTVQLPVFNERAVVERLIDAAAALDYPAGRLDIQVLDDSTDETVALAARAVARHRARGVAIRLLHRDRRDGHKAGALAAGLAVAGGDLIAVFDADFVPRPDFLLRLVPHFGDPGVGMVQARWGHLNRDHSLLTRAQATMLDAHFALEHASRMASGLFFNFNGTAGIWRRRCIERAGGWTHDTLTEDLDLSYRAQLDGWRFVFDGSVEVPAELPEDTEAFKSQQRRWVKGSIQTARKLLVRLLRSPLPARVRLESLVHLTSNAAYPLLLIVSVLLLPTLWAAGVAGPLAALLQAGVLLFGLLPVVLFLATGQRAVGRPWPAALRDALLALVVGAGLSINNARAVCEGLAGPVGRWERTPKTGPDRAPRYSGATRFAGSGEALMAGYAVALLATAIALGAYRAIPFAALLIAGFTVMAAGSLRARRHGGGLPR